jgi:hypothetical protein
MCIHVDSLEHPEKIRKRGSNFRDPRLQSPQELGSKDIHPQFNIYVRIHGAYFVVDVSHACVGATCFVLSINFSEHVSGGIQSKIQKGVL